MSTDMAVAFMPGNDEQAARLAEYLGVAAAPVEVHAFPDGETRVRVSRPAAASLLYCTLDRPNEKIAPLIFAASALRENGARDITLVAPYLCYMRQDCAFHEGEAVSQRVIARMLSPWIDRIVTIEPHLHRTPTLDGVFSEVAATALTAAPLLEKLIAEDRPVDGALLVGPDSEAKAWTQSLAAKTGLPFLVLSKERGGDREVSVSLNTDQRFDGRTVYLVDDIISTGNTVIAAQRLLKDRGAAVVEVLAVHALSADADLARMRAAGVSRIRSTDSVPHETNAISVAPLLGDFLDETLEAVSPA